MERWLSDSLAVFDQVTTGQQILIGSSMGGWLAFLIARARPDRVHAIVGLATAADFTEDLVWNALSDAQKKIMVKQGFIETPSEYGDKPYVMTHRLIESGRKFLILRDRLGIPCPVRLVHGMEDRDVPWQTSLRLAEALDSTDVRLILIKDAGHRLSRDGDLALLRGVVEELRGAQQRGNPEIDGSI